MPNPVIGEAIKSAPRATGITTPLQRPISLRNLLPKAREADGRRPYVNYAGSLTTPPCSTGVDWYVFMDPLQVRGRQGRGREGGVQGRAGQAGRAAGVAQAGSRGQAGGRLVCQSLVAPPR